MDFTESEIAYLITAVNALVAITNRQLVKHVSGTRLHSALIAMLDDLNSLHDKLVTEYDK